MTTVTVDRHVLASSPSGYDLAWRSFGWSPAIAGPRASRLEEEVPWGTLADRSATPGWLTGSAHRILAPDNLDRLQWSFLPLDGRLGLSVWGAFGNRTAEAGKRRVVTHTHLLDPADFRRLAGYPMGLFGSRERPARWLESLASPDAFHRPGGLPALRVRAGLSLGRAFRRARTTEVARLAARLVGHLGYTPDRLAAAVAVLYDALARVHAADGAGTVALRDDVPGAPILVRLTWLSLPLPDRERTWFCTEQARTERPRAHLVVLPRVEWGRAQPAGVRILELGDEPAPEHAGYRGWAEAITAVPHSRGARAALDQADLRGWPLLGPDRASGAIPVRERLAAGAVGTPAAVAALAGLEGAGTRPRAVAVGHLWATAGGRARGGDLPGQARQRLDEARALGLDLSALLRGAVRRWARQAPPMPALAGFVRCWACLGSSEPDVLRDLVRLGGPESTCLDALLDHEEGLPAMVLAAAAALQGGLDPGGGPRVATVAAALRRPEHVARVLVAGTRIPADPLLEVVGWDPVLIARAVDLVGVEGLEPFAVAPVVRGWPSDEALGALARTWGECLGDRSARLQLLTHPAWVETAFAGRAFRLARKLTREDPRDGTAPLEPDGRERVLSPWREGAGDGPWGDEESQMLADLVPGLWAPERCDERSGEAVVGQPWGGVVLGSPAVSPSAPVEQAILPRLSLVGVDRVLERIGAVWSVPSLHPAPGVLPALLSNPALARLRHAGSLHTLLHLLWNEWHREGGLPSLTTVKGIEAPWADLWGRLLEAGPPLGVRSALRRARAGGAVRVAGGRRVLAWSRGR